MLKTLVRLNEDNIRCIENESIRDAAKRMARAEFHKYYPGEPILALGIVEIDAVKRELVIKIVWN